MKPRELMIAVSLAGLGWPAAAAAADGRVSFCAQTASAAFAACQAAVQADFWIATGRCTNVTERAERRACEAEAKEDRGDAKAECGEQYDARRELCDLLGGGRYDPEFDPADFVDPDDIGGSVAPNPYLPLIVGARWVYKGGGETDTVTVTDKTKLIGGVTCRVVHDVVEVGGQPVEVTDDWLAQDLEGNVWYCGEITQESETFAGDVPEEPEVVTIEGSWKAGRDGDKPGKLVLAFPQVGDVYLEEFSLGNAEDAAQVTSVTGTATVPAASCHGTCLVTRNFTPLSPGPNETKYYAPGVGLILEVSGHGERNELVEFAIP